MKIAKLSIRNIMGVTELDIEPGTLTQVTGTNGTGKTSVLEAIKSIVREGHDATLLRDGAEEGEVVLVLDDGMQITKRVREGASTREVRGEDGKKIARPADAIARLLDALSVNPIEFLMAPKKDRVRVLLESMPIELDLDKLSKLSGINVTAQPGLHALSVIEMVTKQVYDARTGTNGAIKEKKATISQLTQALPPKVDGVSDDEEELTASVSAARDAKDAELARISGKLDGVRTAHQSEIDAIRSKLQEDIDALKAAATKQADDAKAKLADIENKAAMQREKTVTKFNDAVAPLQAALTNIRENREAVARRKVTEETIATMETELVDLEKKSKAQTTALGAIEAHKSELLATLPIPGLEVKEGEIYRDGIVLDRLNTAQQVQIAVDLAQLRAGELGIVCVDRIESLDSDSFEAFKESIADSGLQLFVTRVGDDEFAVTTSDD